MTPKPPGDNCRPGLLNPYIFQALLMTERILGMSHKDTVFRYMYAGASYADTNQVSFQSSVKIYKVFTQTLIGLSPCKWGSREVANLKSKQRDMQHWKNFTDLNQFTCLDPTNQNQNKDL